MMSATGVDCSADRAAAAVNASNDAPGNSCFNANELSLANLAIERSSASDGYGGGSSEVAVDSSPAAAISLLLLLPLLLRSVGASGIRIRGERRGDRRWSRPE